MNEAEYRTPSPVQALPRGGAAHRVQNSESRFPTMIGLEHWQACDQLLCSLTAAATHAKAG